MKTISPGSDKSSVRTADGVGERVSHHPDRVVRLQREVNGNEPQQQWQALGKHILLEAYHDNLQTLDDVEYLRNLLCRAALAAETEPLKFGYHRYEPQGISCFLILAESHISVHTWPQFGYASFDIYTCGGRPEKAARKILELLKPYDYQIQQIIRGPFDEVQQHIDEHFKHT